MSLTWINVGCPYCGETFETAVDTSAGSQHYVEDCAICCRPIIFDVDADREGEPDVRTRRDDDAG